MVRATAEDIEPRLRRGVPKGGEFYIQTAEYSLPDLQKYKKASTNYNANYNAIMDSQVAPVHQK